MRFERIKIVRDTQTVHNRAVVEWEIPVLEFIFDEANVERLGIFEENGEETPSVASEYERLAGAYGKDSQSGVPHVASVYGNGSAGLRNLRKAMEDAEAEAAKADVPPLSFQTTSKQKGAKVVDALLN